MLSRVMQALAYISGVAAFAAIFDNAFEAHKFNEKNFLVNNWVKQLANAIDIAAS